MVLYAFRHIVLEAGGECTCEARLRDGSSERPDAAITLQAGSFYIDVSITHPCAASYMHRPAEEQLRAREHLKVNKYQAAARLEGREVLPLVMDTFGGMAPHGLTEQLLQLVANQAQANGIADLDPAKWSVQGLSARLVVALHRGNACLLERGTAAVRNAVQGRRYGLR